MSKLFLIESYHHYILFCHDESIVINIETLDLFLKRGKRVKHWYLWRVWALFVSQLFTVRPQSASSVQGDNMSRRSFSSVWPHDWPFKKNEFPIDIFEKSTLKKLFDTCLEQHPEFAQNTWTATSIFKTIFFNEPERKLFCHFCATNEKEYSLPEVLGSLTKYTKEDATFLFQLLYVSLSNIHPK